MDVYTPAQAVDFTDTGVWRLIIYISCRGMTALLKHTEDPAQPLVRLFSTSWDDDGAPLLQKIESAIYDHPRVLEDYATDIIVETPRLTWMPDELLDLEDAESTVFYSIFPTVNGEFLSEQSAGITALYSLCDGLGAFISRTIPGARVRPHISILVDRLRRLSAETPVVYVDVRDGEADLIAFDGKQLLSTVTHKWQAPADVAYRIFQLADALGLSAESLIVSLSGQADVVEELKEFLSEHCRKVTKTAIPAAEATDMPLAAAILAFG